jgi:meiotically up-regulated gene 157 (Mug157) protein
MPYLIGKVRTMAVIMVMHHSFARKQIADLTRWWWQWDKG